MCSTHTTRLFFEIFSILPHFRSILASINSPFINQVPLSLTPPFTPLSPLNLSFFPTFQYFIEQFPNHLSQTKFIPPTFSNSLYVSTKCTFLPNSFLLYNVNFSLPYLKNPFPLPPASTSSSPLNSLFNSFKNNSLQLLPSPTTITFLY